MQALIDSVTRPSTARFNTSVDMIQPGRGVPFFPKDVKTTRQTLIKILTIWCATMLYKCERFNALSSQISRSCAVLYIYNGAVASGVCSSVNETAGVPSNCATLSKRLPLRESTAGFLKILFKRELLVENDRLSSRFNSQSMKRMF